MVIDSHTHAWGPDTAAHPWINTELIEIAENHPIPTTYTADALLDDMDATGIDQAVVVGYPIANWRDNHHVIEATRNHDALYGIVLLNPLADGAPEQLRELMANNGVIGFRLAVLHARDAMWAREATSATWLRDAIDRTEFWVAASETDAIVQVFAHFSQLNQVLELVETYPDLRYVVDHFARLDPTADPLEAGFGTFSDLAAYETVYPKLSAAPFLSNQDFPYTDLHEYVDFLLDAFGPERLVWGSDYQFVSNLATYDQTLKWLDAIECLSRRDIEWVTRKTFDRKLLP